MPVFTMKDLLGFTTAVAVILAFCADLSNASKYPEVWV